MIWLGSRRGYLTDWITQKWVQITGRRVSLDDASWLGGPVGRTKGIGAGFFENLARADGLQLRAPDDAGLISSVSTLESSELDVSRLDSGVIDFYEHTAAYDLDAWSEWSGLFRPFGRLLAILFSRRLQQLNVPLTALDTCKGITSRVVHLVEPNGAVRHTAWIRKLVGTDNVLYAGSYSVCRVPRHSGPCIKVVFPLPNGNAMVIMRANGASDGSLLLASSGAGFGDTGFYFTVHDGNGKVWARYLRTFRETIHVYPDGSTVRADHILTIWRTKFLRLHYRLKRRGGKRAEAAT